MQKFSEIIRSKLFWSLDYVRQGHIKNNLDDIKSLIEEGNTDVSIARKNMLLNSILSHATLTTVYYSGFAGFKSLRDFPVVNKTIIRELTDQFCSFKYGPLERISVVTSGSTGTPFKTYQDKGKKQRNYADTIYFSERAGFQIGNKLIYLKIWAKEKMKSYALYKIQNFEPIDVLHLGDDQISKLITEIQNGPSTFGLLGYSSSLELICKYLDKIQPSKLKTHVKSIIAISEALNEDTKARLNKYFGINPVSRYSNLENGIIAQQDPDNNQHFLINTASYFIELLKMDSDEAEIAGKPGRIVITDLFNYAMPIIRYDTGDIGVLENEESEYGMSYLSGVEGRKLDLLFDTRGNLVSSYIVYKNMWQYTEIKQYQLIQNGMKEYLFKINMDSHFIREAQLINEFKSYLGQDADFKIEYVKEIPLLNSGKRRKIVNNYIRV